jgi:hypothetical protein
MRLGNQTAHRDVSEDDFYRFLNYYPDVLAPEWRQFFCRKFFGKDYDPQNENYNDDDGYDYDYDDDDDDDDDDGA